MTLNQRVYTTCAALMLPAAILLAYRGLVRFVEGEILRQSGGRWD